MSGVLQLLAAPPTPLIYTTFNPGDTNALITLSNGNLTATCSTGNNFASRAFDAKSSGKWFYQATITTVGSAVYVGVGNSSQSISNGIALGNSVNSWGYSSTGLVYYNNSGTGSRAAYSSGDVIGIAYNGDDDELSFYKNGNLESTAITGVTGTFYPMISQVGNSVVTVNFGASGWTYTPPAGYSGWVVN